MPDLPAECVTLTHFTRRVRSAMRDFRQLIFDGKTRKIGRIKNRMGIQRIAGSGLVGCPFSIGRRQINRGLAATRHGVFARAHRSIRDRGGVRPP